MKEQPLINELKNNFSIEPLSVEQFYSEETYITVKEKDFVSSCAALHKLLDSPVVSFFALDERKAANVFELICCFESRQTARWVFVKLAVAKDNPSFPSLSREMFSAALFEREIKEMFGIEPVGCPDVRRLRLHDEVWHEGFYPLRKDFNPPPSFGTGKQYVFQKIEGEGVFEVPVGPVHAGIIGPGHFRFSAAGEPIINLEIRLGFTHRGAEKLFEGKTPEDCVGLSECISGDAAFGHSLAFCCAVEKIRGISVTAKEQYARAVFLELERMYNHAAGIGGIALDVGFSYPSAYASLIKESILALNEKLTGSRYLKGVNRIGGTNKTLSAEEQVILKATLAALSRDMGELKTMLFESVSFMDRADTTGILSFKVARDIGVTGLAGRACGIPGDLRSDFPGVYKELGFKSACETSGDVLARLKVRVNEFNESCRMIDAAIGAVHGTNKPAEAGDHKNTFALGYAEGWRGPLLYWVKVDGKGSIDRCKITDASFHNWLGLSYAAPGNIIPDFPLCNKSFDLSYPGNDL